MEQTLTPAAETQQQTELETFDRAAWETMINEVFAPFEAAVERFLTRLDALSDERTVRA